MSLSQSLQLKQQQSLVMTPQLQQAIQMLQLGQYDLAQLIEKELESNPFLEVGEQGEAPRLQITEKGDKVLTLDKNERQGTDSAPSSDSSQQAQSTSDTTNEDQASGDILDESELPRLDKIAGDETSSLADQSEDHWDLSATDSDAGDQDMSFGGSGGEDYGSSQFSDLNLAENLGEAETLEAYLARAIPLVFPNIAERKIAEQLCYFLEEAGYLVLNEDETCQTLGIESIELLSVIDKLQSLEPAGLFARSLQECLRLQLVDKGLMTPLLELVLEHLEQVAKGDLAWLSKLFACPVEDIKAALVTIRRLNPKPGLIYESGQPQLKIPDVFVRKRQDDSWIIELNTERLPRVLVNERYSAIVTKEPAKQAPSKDQEELVEKMNSASWLVKALEQRAQTILRVTSTIVELQSEFFERGMLHLKPMVQREVADKLELHESTISRVTHNKYMETPRGTFELKFFFSSSIAGADGADALSSTSVQAHIKNLIATENQKKPLSDDKIVKLLADQSITVARRTVAKYREGMGIGSSVERKQAYALGF